MRGNSGHGDTERPNIFRVFDVYLGGSFNTLADRRLAARIAETGDGTPELVWESRQFFDRAVIHAASLGIRQFIETEAWPTVPLHQMISTDDPAPRVVYTSSEPLVVDRLDGLVPDQGHVAVIGALPDDPDVILADPRVQKVIDLDEPVCVTFNVWLRYRSSGQARHIIRSWASRVAPGSYLAVNISIRSRGLLNFPELFSPAHPPHLHDMTSVTSWFRGLDLPDGITDVRAWHQPYGNLPPRQAGFVAGAMARVPPRYHAKTAGSDDR